MSEKITERDVVYDLLMDHGLAKYAKAIRGDIAFFVLEVPPGIIRTQNEAANLAQDINNALANIGQPPCIVLRDGITLHPIRPSKDHMTVDEVIDQVKEETGREQ